MVINYLERPNDWLVVIKTKAQSINGSLESRNLEKYVSYQDESITQFPITIMDDNLEESLVDIRGQVEEAFVDSLDEVDFEDNGEVEIEEVIVLQEVEKWKMI